MPPTEIQPGTAILLNGAPRSGKSSIAAAIQQVAAEPWMNLGIDRYLDMTPPRYRPGIYDIEVDTSKLSAEACAEQILRHIRNDPEPDAFRRLAAMSTEH